MTDRSGIEKNTFLKNVLEVKGNEQTFIVKTSPKHSKYEIWVLFESRLVNQKEDYRGLEAEELERVLDTLKVDFHEVFN